MALADPALELRAAARIGQHQKDEEARRGDWIRSQGEIRKLHLLDQVVSELYIEKQLARNKSN